MTIAEDKFDDELDVEGLPDRELLGDLKDFIQYASENEPRSLQTTLGPSEVGHPCARKLAYGLTATGGGNSFGDPLPSIVGKATHGWLENAARMDNKRLGRTRWIPETRVHITDSLSGTCDLYDVDTQTVLDWKVPGVTRFKKYVKHGPSVTYRGQSHLYGKGYKNAGLPVSHVGIVFIPKAGTLRQTHLWRESYDEELVQSILTRIDSVKGLITGLDLEHHADRFKLIPITPDADCYLCSWWSPGPDPSNPFQCGGQAELK